MVPWCGRGGASPDAPAPLFLGLFIVPTIESIVREPALNFGVIDPAARPGARYNAPAGDAGTRSFRTPAPLKHKPHILGRHTVARSRLFRVDAVDLEFGNGARRNFEQLVASGEGGVVVIPVTGKGEVVLIEEYALGTNEYELGFVKGLIDHGESARDAALRELREETGLAARRLELLDEVTLMPAYSNFRSSLFVALDLYDDPLEGDEPEPLEQVRWPLERIEHLHADSRITDARTRLALFLLTRHLRRASRLPDGEA